LKISTTPDADLFALQTSAEMQFVAPVFFCLSGIGYMGMAAYRCTRSPGRFENAPFTLGFLGADLGSLPERLPSLGRQGRL
jgi:hypothetical protein